MAKHIYVLSDIHLGTNQDWDWFKKGDQANRLEQMLNSIAASDDAAQTDLVFAGDVFDTWLTPPDITPRSIQDILAEVVHQSIYDAIRNCVSKCKAVYYMNGNHDMHVTAQDLAFFSKDGKQMHYVVEYPNEEVHIEHGHQFSMINAMDMVNSPEDGGLPIGYYITRMCAKHEDFYKKPEAILEIIKELFDSCEEKETFAEFLLDGIASAVGMAPTVTFKLPNGQPGPTVADVKFKYKDLYQQWVAKHPPGRTYANNSVLLELGSLQWFANYEFDTNQNKLAVAVMGHTHKDAIRSESVPPSGVYANSGCWVEEDPSYVQIKNLGNNFDVCLYTWTVTGQKVLRGSRLSPYKEG